MLLNTASSLEQLGGPALLLVQAAEDPLLKGLAPDLGFVDLMLEVEFIEFRLDPHTLVEAATARPLGPGVPSCPVQARKEDFTDRFGEPFADDWKVILDDMSQLP